MSSDNSRQQPPRFSNSTLHLSLSVAGFLGVIFLAGYIGSHINDFEDQLLYQPPVSRSQSLIGTPINIKKGQTVYVPAYSHVYSDDGQPHLLTITLSIRNTDPDRSIRVVDTRYFNARGELVKSYVDGVIDIAPLQSVNFLVEKHDREGGAGASFIITWKSDEPVYEPIIEAIMIGLTKEHDISFITSARPLAGRVKNNSK